MQVKLEITVDTANLKKALNSGTVAKATKTGVQQTLEPATKRNFKSEGFAGQRWQALKPRTLADRAAKGFPPGPILYRTGKLSRSYSIQVKGNIVVWDWRTPYASTHQWGVLAAHLPARPFILGLGATPADVQGVEQLCQVIAKQLGL